MGLRAENTQKSGVFPRTVELKDSMEEDPVLIRD